MLGNYTDDVTFGGTVGQVALGVIGVDLPADIRDISADLVNWEWSWSHAGKTLLDTIGLIPIVGSLKYADEVGTLIKYSDETAEAVAETTKKINKLDEVKELEYYDFIKANQAAGYKSTPKGYTWHHVEDGTTMMLVPSDLNGTVRHTGGDSLIREGIRP